MKKIIINAILYLIEILCVGFTFCFVIIFQELEGILCFIAGIGLIVLMITVAIHLLYNFSLKLEEEHTIWW